MELSKIYEGWRNKLVPPAELKDVIEKVSSERMDVCNTCEHHSENAKKKGFSSMRPDIHCTNCGCTLSAKTKCLSCACPLDKWKAVLTDKQEQEIEKHGAIK